MKLSSDMAQSLNEQIVLEAQASSNYLAMACWCEVNGYDGGAAYFYAQSDEERMHQLKMVKFMNGMDTPAVIPKIAKPSMKFSSLEDVIKASLSEERKVTQQVSLSLKLAHQKSVFAVMDILLWFANEQVQEETKFEALLQKFDTIGRDPVAINEIDKILAAQAVQA